ncbi:MAG: outer membrane protein assembly factor BamD [Bacteroidales bacterium]|nr:outer membrane protein assembly factor BamD [Bacteroidales bacterium]
MKITSLLIAFVLLASCSGYEKLLKSSDYKLKYDKAFEYYNDEQYVKASTLFDQIANVYQGTRNADSVYFFQAMSYFNQRDYILSGHYFSTFARTYGGSEFVEEAEYKAAYCFYKQSPRPSLDQSNTLKAIQAFQLYLIKYPKSERADECKEIVIELREKLVEKSFTSARLYFDLADYKASLVALNNSLNEYPDSKFREDIKFLILKSSFLLAENSIINKQRDRYQDTVDEYYSFVTEFPESKFKKEVDRIYETSNDFIK